jgi:hypothetical protein
MPFEVTPVTEVKNSAAHVSDTYEFDEDVPIVKHGPIQSWYMGTKLYDFGYGVFCSIASITLGLAIKVMVDSLRDSILQPHQPPIVQNNPDRKTAGEHLFNVGDIIIR